MSQTDPLPNVSFAMKASFTNVPSFRNTWMRSFDAESIKTSIGAEFSGNLIIGFYFPLTATAGVAWGHDGSGVVRDGAIGYFRAGISF